MFQNKLNLIYIKHNNNINNNITIYIIPNLK